MHNLYESFNETNSETFYLSEIEIPYAPDSWELHDFDDILQEAHSQ